MRQLLSIESIPRVKDKALEDIFSWSLWEREVQLLFKCDFSNHKAREPFIIAMITKIIFAIISSHSILYFIEDNFEICFENRSSISSYDFISLRKYLLISIFVFKTYTILSHRIDSLKLNTF